MPRSTFLTGLLLASIFNTAQAKSVIGFAVTGGASHQAACAQIGLELVQRGHDFAMLVSSGDTLSQARLARQPYGTLKVHKFSGPAHIGTPDWLRKLDRDPQKNLAWLRQNGLDIAQSLLTDKNTIEVLKAANFDLVLRDIVSWPSHLLSQILDKPEVDVLTLGCLQPFFGPRYSIPNPLAYIPGMTSTAVPPMGFGQRLDNHLQYLLMRYFVMSDTSRAERQLSERFGFTADGAWMRRSNAAAVIVTGDWALEWPFPIPPKVHMVGPLMALPPEPIAKDLQTFLNQTPDDPANKSPQIPGAVFVSMGTNVRLTEAEARGLARNLAALKRPVLWKISDIELPVNLTLDSLQLPKHVKPIPWAPQNDILGHPAIKVFVTHAGANSLYEAAYHAVPVVAIPIFGDQHRNAAQSAHHGFGLVLSAADLKGDRSIHIHDAINRIIGDRGFQVNATKVQRRLRKPRTPVQQAADVVEHALATGAEDYLDTAEHLYTWWQLVMLDVHVCIVACVAAVVGLVWGLFWLVGRYVRRDVMYVSSSASKQKVK